MDREGSSSPSPFSDPGPALDRWARGPFHGADEQPGAARGRDALAPAESQARPLRQGLSPARGLGDQNTEGSILHLSQSPSSGTHSRDWAGGSHWKSQPGARRLGKGRALKINRSAQRGAAGGGLVSRRCRLALPAGDGWPVRGGPRSGSWPLGGAAGRWQPGIYDPRLPGAPPPPHIHAHSHPCTPPMPQPGYSPQSVAGAVPREGARAGPWDAGDTFAAAASLNTGRGVSPRAPQSLLP